MTVLCHFFNEEFLLKPWLLHHIQVFDHGIMINYGSTDKSVEIIKSLAPDWTLVDSINDKFNAELVDYEIMRYEEVLEGWKVCLNVTEFFFPKNMDFEQITEPCVMRCDPYFIVDPTGDYNKPWGGTNLFENLYGFSEWEANGKREPGMTRARMVHNLDHGHYNSGRHDSWKYGWSGHNEALTLLYMADYPRSSEMLKRKMQILDKLDKEHEPLNGKELHNKGHYRTRKEWEQYHEMLLAKSSPLELLHVN